jgi:RND family efflux transporter MFP subunit
LVLLLAACEPAPPPVPDPQIERVARVMQVRARVEGRELRFVGQVEAAQTVDLKFEVGGTLKLLNAREGETLRAGTLVAALDKREFELALREAEVQRQLAKQDLDRKTALLARRVIPQATVDDATALFELRTVHLEQARKNLTETEILAPFDAYVVNRFIDNHGVVQSGTAVARIADLNELLVSVNVPEALLATIPESNVAAISAQFPFIDGESFPLFYRENRGEADPVAQTYRVTMSMHPPARWNILPGMTARVTVTLDETPGVDASVLVPAGAVVATPEGEFAVWSFDHDSGAVARVPVKVEADASGGFRVTSGLQGGEWIIAAGAHQVQPGMRIRPLNES